MFPLANVVIGAARSRAGTGSVGRRQQTAERRAVPDTPFSCCSSANGRRAAPFPSYTNMDQVGSSENGVIVVLDDVDALCSRMQCAKEQSYHVTNKTIRI